MTTPILFYACFRAFCFFGNKNQTGRPNPAKPLLLPGNDPKSFCKSFPTLLRSPLCVFLRKIFKDIGIHPRLYKEASFKASSLPRRSGRSPLQYLLNAWPILVHWMSISRMCSAPDTIKSICVVHLRPTSYQLTNNKSAL